jgi:hypothetical protein
MAGEHEEVAVEAEGVDVGDRDIRSCGVRPARCPPGELQPAQLEEATYREREGEFTPAGVLLVEEEAARRDEISGWNVARPGNTRQPGVYLAVDLGTHVGGESRAAERLLHILHLFDIRIATILGRMLLWLRGDVRQNRLRPIRGKSLPGVARHRAAPIGEKALGCGLDRYGQRHHKNDKAHHRPQGETDRQETAAGVFGELHVHPAKTDLYRGDRTPKLRSCRVFRQGKQGGLGWPLRQSPISRRPPGFVRLDAGVPRLAHRLTPRNWIGPEPDQKRMGSSPRGPRSFQRPEPRLTTDAVPGDGWAWGRDWLADQPGEPL